MDFQELFLILSANSSSGTQAFNSGIVNSPTPMLGCKIPYLRRLARGLTWLDVADLPQHRLYEVDMLQGIVLSQSKMPFAEKSPLLRKFAFSLDNWAVCDSATVKVPCAESDLYFDFFAELSASETAFACRYGLVNLLANYLDDSHIDSVFATLGAVNLWGSYYVDMAAAWLVATALPKCNEATRAYMSDAGRRVMSRAAYNAALQKMRDSRRVSAADKAWTYTMTR